MAQIEPYLSVVVTARNDDHGGNLLGRMQAFVNGWMALARRYAISSELIVVEWNPPQDRPPLSRALQWPKEFGPTQVRFITVTPELHARYAHSDALPLYQMIAKNAGIRRASGQFVLATNIDILFSKELAAYIAGKHLEAGRMYRIDRHDVMREVPVDGSIEDQLAYCESHLLRVNAREGTFKTSPAGDWLACDRDIVDPDAGVVFRHGWYPPEAPEGQMIRFLDNNGEIGVNLRSAPGPQCELVIDVGPGPAVRNQPFVLQILCGGKLQARIWIRERSSLRLAFDFSGPAQIDLQFHVVNGGRPCAPDPRTLNLTVYGCRWEEASLARAEQAFLPGTSVLTRLRRGPSGAAAYTIGNVVDCTCGSTPPFLTSGWGPPDGEGCWTVGGRANISMKVDEANAGKPLIATFTITSAIVDDTKPYLNVSVLANGYPVASWRVGPTRATAHWKALIPAGMIGANGQLDIAFAIDEPRSPLQLNWSDDARPLGFRLGLFQMERPHKYALGKLELASGDPPPVLGLHQWSPPDGEGCWTAGPQASIALQPETAPGGSVSATFRISGSIVDESAPELRVQVVANGRHVDEWLFNLDTRAPHDRTVSLPPIDRCGALLLNFEVPTPRSPASLGWSEDHRPLGIRIERALFLEHAPVGRPTAPSADAEYRRSLALDHRIALGRGWTVAQWDLSPDAVAQCGNTGGEIHIDGRELPACALRLEVEPVDAGSSKLQVRDSSGGLVAETSISGPQLVYLRLPLDDQETQVFSIGAEGAGLRLFGLRLCDPPAPARPAGVHLHLNACGDFTLMARRHWIDLRGYPEFDMYSFNIDSLLCYAAHYAGIRELILREPMRIYHIEHSMGSGWTPEGENTLFDRLRAKGIDWIDIREVLDFARQMEKVNSPMIFNREDWGLAGFQLQEVRLPESRPAQQDNSAAKRSVR